MVSNCICLNVLEMNIILIIIGRISFSNQFINCIVMGYSSYWKGYKYYILINHGIVFEYVPSPLMVWMFYKKPVFLHLLFFSLLHWWLILLLLRTIIQLVLGSLISRYRHALGLKNRSHVFIPTSSISSSTCTSSHLLWP